MLVESTDTSHANWPMVPSTIEAPDGYFRSKLYISSSTTNPLIAAASPLFSFLERLCVSSNLPPIETIRDNIEHELYAFHSRLLSREYANEFIKMANYLLTATIDELLGKHYMRVYEQSTHFQAFTPPSNDSIGPENRFFDIVHHLKQNATQCLDLIELAYHCLITGFEGQYHQRSDGRQELDNLIEELFQLIKQNRVNKPLRLFHEQAPPITHTIQHKSIITATLSATTIIIATYLISHSLLNHQANDVLMNHSTLIAASY